MLGQGRNLRVLDEGGSWGAGSTQDLVKEIPESEIQAKLFADAGEKHGEILATKIRRFSPFNFQGKWPQKNSRKILHIFHEGRNKILSQRGSGSGGPLRT